MQAFRYQRTGSFRAWLRTVVANKWREIQRRKSIPVGDEYPLDLVTPGASSEFWENEYRQILVSRAMTLMQASFEENTWKACWGTAVESRTAKDVAQELGMSEGAVFVAKSRVLKRLREELVGLWD
jgi:RNA polymerase sigma-70 factor, ECF subfamily